MQVPDQTMEAMFLVDIAQPVNNQFPVLEVDSLNVFYIHSNNYVTPVYMTKKTIFQSVQRLEWLWLAEADASRREAG